MIRGGLYIKKGISVFKLKIFEKAGVLEYIEVAFGDLKENEFSYVHKLG
jgi:hypothetical protein